MHAETGSQTAGREQRGYLHIYIYLPRTCTCRDTRDDTRSYITATVMLCEVTVNTVILIRNTVNLYILNYLYLYVCMYVDVCVLLIIMANG